MYASFDPLCFVEVHAGPAVATPAVATAHGDRTRLHTAAATAGSAQRGWRRSQSEPAARRPFVDAREVLGYL